MANTSRTCSRTSPALRLIAIALLLVVTPDARSDAGFAAGAQQPEPRAVVLDPETATMIGEVDQSALWNRVGDLSGESAVLIEGSPYTITTRHTGSGEPIAKACTYVFESMDALGLDVTYQPWSGGAFSGTNVVAEKPGRVAPDEIVLLTAQLDSVPSSGAAPGADNDASGVAAVMVAAEIMSQRNFERTIRFIVFTGTEQGLLGSSASASEAAALGDTIIAVLHLDMIGWDSTGGPVLRLHTRTSSSPGYAGDLAIATTFIDVVAAYSLDADLTCVHDADGLTYSDHASYWSQGYPGVLAIEDDEDDFNPYFSTANDLREHLNMSYLTSFAKAVVGTVSHLAVRTDVPVALMTYSVE